MDRGKCHRQLEQSGYERLWPRYPQAGRRDFSLSTGTNWFNRTCPGDTVESHPRWHSRLRIRAVAQKSGPSLLHRVCSQADCGKLDQVEPRTRRPWRCPAEIRAATPAAFSSLAIFCTRPIPERTEKCPQDGKHHRKNYQTSFLIGAKNDR